MNIFNKTLSAVIKIQFILVPFRMITLYFNYLKLEEIIQFEILLTMYIVSFFTILGFIHLLSLKKNWVRIVWIVLFFISIPSNLLPMYKTLFFETSLSTGALIKLLTGTIQISLQSWCIYLLCTKPVKLEFLKQS